MSSQDALKTDRPLLTIAIPTYNRSLLLDRLLSALFEQTRSEPRVELIVSDNASQDDTAVVVQKFLGLGMLLRYFCNRENLGPDRNILQCFENATGKYVWIVGDDDVIEPGGLAAVLAYLSRDEYDLVYVSARGYKGQYVPTVHGAPRGAQMYSRPEEFARRIHIMFTFISANIVNKDRATALRREEFSSLAGTHLVHLGWIFTALDNLRKGLLIEDEFVAGQMDNSGGYSVFEVFGPKLKSIVDSWIRSRVVRRTIIACTLHGFLPGLILDSKHNHDSFFRSESSRALRVAWGDDTRYWVFDAPVTFLPAPLDRFWVFVARVTCKMEFLVRWRLMKRFRATEM